jgi:hypothetical protein
VDKVQPKTEAQKQIESKVRVVQKLMKTRDGKKLMSILEDEFDSDTIMVKGDPYTTAYHLGRRDAVVYLKQLLEYKIKRSRRA